MASTAYGEPLSIDRLTSTNIFALRRVIEEYADANGVFAKIDATAVPHIKRAIRAGAVESAGRGLWKLSAAGKRLLAGEKLSGVGVWPPW